MNLIINGLEGCAIGAKYSLLKKKEDEIKQGKNYLLSSLFLIFQVYCVGSLIPQLSKNFVKNPFVQRSINLGVLGGCVLYVPFAFFFANVRHGKHEKLFNNCSTALEFFRKKLKKDSKWLYVIPKTIFFLPEKAGNKIKKISFFATEYLGSILNTAIIIGSIALIFFGNPWFGGSALLGLGYGVADRMGWIPKKISLFMEAHIEKIAILMSLLNGNILIKSFDILDITISNFNGFNKNIQQKIDLILRKYGIISSKTPPLKEFDTPFVSKEELDFDQINEILDSPDQADEINPRHCCQQIQSLPSPKNKNLDDYLIHFVSVDWEKRYNLVISKLVEDEQFVFFIKDNQIIKEDLTDSKKLMDYFNNLVKVNGIPKEKYIANFLKDQMNLFISVIKEERSSKGTQKELQEMINLSYSVLDHLDSIQLKNSVEFEDILLKLAVEGGNNCGAGIKRALSEIVEENIYQNEFNKTDSFKETKSYELKINLLLKDLRKEIILSNYKNGTVFLPHKQNQDVHVFNMCFSIFSFGFYPISQDEREKIGILDFLFLSDLRRIMYKQYRERMREVLKDAGKIGIATYILQSIKNNSRLTDEQKEQLKEKLEDLYLNERTIQQKAERLFLLMLGVTLFPKKNL